MILRRKMLININDLLANSCIERESSDKASLILTGGDNLPVNPSDASVSSYPTGGIRAIPSGTSESLGHWEKGEPIVKATGVYELPNGELVMSRECAP